MGFGGSGSNSIGSATDTAISNPALNDVLTYSALGKWQNLPAPANSGVTSVNTRTGAVTLTKSDVGLGNIDNTADVNKPVSTAVQSALDAKVDTSKLVLSSTRPSSPALGTIWIQNATGVDTTAPTAPTLATPTTTSTSVSLSWSGATDNVGVTGYDVYRSGSKLNSSPISGTTYTDSSLTPNTSYGPYTVRSRDAAGNVSGDSNSQTVSTASTGDTTAPSVPTNVNATAGNGQASVTWTASTDNVAVTGYKIYVNGSLAGTSGTTNYTAAGLSNGTTYSITVAAYDAAGNTSAQSSAASVTPAAPADTTAPSVPTGVNATAGNAQATVGWSASTDNVAVTGYNIYVNGSFAGTSTTTNYLATGLSNGTTYSITVAAYDAAGNTSAQSTAASVTPNGTPGAAFTDSFTRADVASGTAGSTVIGNGWTVVSGNWAISSNQLKVNSNATTGQLGNTSTVNTNDMYGQITYAGGAPTSSSVYLVLRASSDLSSFLGLRFTPLPSSGNSAITFVKCISGSITNVGSTTTLGSNINNGDVLRFEVNGSSLVGKINGSQVGSVTSTSVPTGSGFALRVTTAQNMLLDDAAWGDL